MVSWIIAATELMNGKFNLFHFFSIGITDPISHEIICDFAWNIGCNIYLSLLCFTFLPFCSISANFVYLHLRGLMKMLCVCTYISVTIHTYQIKIFVYRQLILLVLQTSSGRNEIWNIFHLSAECLQSVERMQFFSKCIHVMLVLRLKLNHVDSPKFDRVITYNK